ncbi:MAG: hypothetical protein SYC29_12380 [Planctomycetota bacterium]|nr:hypothetical protein [Planctomycetota bacterium]
MATLLIALIAAASLLRGPAPLPPADAGGTGTRPAEAAVASPPDCGDETAPPASRPDTAGEDEPVANDDPVIALLDTLERSADDLRAFTASIHYVVEDALLGEKVIRKGELVYRADPEGGEKSFAILFESRIANGRKRDQLKHYVFSGGWFVEVDHDEKLFIKRQVVAEGEEYDPLKLGEGPFPLPVGQERAEVLARFQVSLLALPETGPLAKLRGETPVDGLRLIPRPGSQAAEDIARIDLFYDRDTHLPIGIDLIETNGDRKTARLGNLKRNPTLSKSALAKLSIDEPDPTEWRIDIRELER